MDLFIIDGRPSQDVFFTADQSMLVRVGADGSVAEASDEDPAHLRSTDMENLADHASVQKALGLALSFAQARGWNLDTETVYFD